MVRISIVAMMIVLAVFIFQTPKKVKKGPVAKDEFLPKDKKKN